MNSNLKIVAKGGDFAKKLQSAKFIIKNGFNLGNLMKDKIKDPSYMLRSLSSVKRK